MPTIKSRVKSLRHVLASELKPSPKNWRTHPKHQRDAMAGVLQQIGYADALLVRELPDGTLQLIDGHLRAETTPDQKVPVLIVDVTQEEANFMLATLDPLAALAGTDGDMLASLMKGIEADDDAVAKMLADISKKNSISDLPPVPDAEREPFRQITFKLHDSQMDRLTAAMKLAKESGGDESKVNTNKNANALSFIVERFLEGAQQMEK